jgi:hypothetical protein
LGNLGLDGIDRRRNDLGDAGCVAIGETRFLGENGFWSSSSWWGDEK